MMFKVKCLQLRGESAPMELLEICGLLTSKELYTLNISFSNDRYSCKLLNDP